MWYISTVTLGHPGVPSFISCQQEGSSFSAWRKYRESVQSNASVGVTTARINTSWRRANLFQQILWIQWSTSGADSIPERTRSCAGLHLELDRLQAFSVSSNHLALRKIGRISTKTVEFFQRISQCSNWNFIKRIHYSHWHFCSICDEWRTFEMACLNIYCCCIWN